MTIRVLVVDDSSFIRRAVIRMLAEDAEISVVGQASHGDEALDLIRTCSPDVITLDLEMPTVGGLATLRRIMSERPTPVVLLSAHAQADATTTLEALAAGAVDFIDKSAVSPMGVHALGDELVRKIRTAALSRPGAMTARPPPGSQDDLATTRDIGAIVLGASTGGPPAIQSIVARLPADFSLPVLVVQHMPPRFTRAFAERLDAGSAVRVKEAEEGDVFGPGSVLVAPAGRHVDLQRTSGGLEIALRHGAPLDLHVPSIDVAAISVASAVADGVCLVVLTGMGVDGAEGARAVKRAGGVILAQDEESSVIYGMPRAVVRAGLADLVLPLARMPELLLRLAQRKQRSDVRAASNRR